MGIRVECAVRLGCGRQVRMMISCNKSAYPKKNCLMQLLLIFGRYHWHTRVQDA
jgi:hypothetical protein